MSSVIVPFLASGTYTPPAHVTSVDVLVVAGGGSGGSANSGSSSGGGGAGGVIYQTVAVTPGVPVTVVVGAGGAEKPAGGAALGNNGADSSFGAVVATGGGGGGAGGGTVLNETGLNGGSGGGGGGHDGSGNPRSGGTGIAGQGFAGGGGTGANFGNNNGGGGGGASAIGSGITPGAGLNYSPTVGLLLGDLGRFGGGGSGGIHNGGTVAGGVGGGGRGAQASGSNPGTPGTANTGGGGGGTQRTAHPGYAGGSGVVIVIEQTATVDTSYNDEVMADTPALYLRLDENIGQALDSSGNARHGTFNGTAYSRNQMGLIAGDTNGCVDFFATGANSDGTLDIPYAAWMDTITAMDFLCRPETAVTGHVISRDDGTNRVFQMGVSGAQKAYFTWWNTDNSTGTLTGTTTLGLNYIAHIAVRLDAGVWQLIVNGTVEATSAAGQSLKVSAVPQMRIGARGEVAAISKFNGKIDEVAVYQTAPSAARFTTHWTAAGSPITLTDARMSVQVMHAGVVLDSEQVHLRVSGQVIQVAVVAPQNVIKVLSTGDPVSVYYGGSWLTTRPLSTP